LLGAWALGRDRTQIEIDVAVLAAPEPGRPQRVLSLGEAKWGETIRSGHLSRLARARDLLADSFDTSACVLACYSAAGFDGSLRGGPGLALITLEEIYDRGRPAHPG